MPVIVCLFGKLCLSVFVWMPVLFLCKCLFVCVCVCLSVLAVCVCVPVVVFDTFAGDGVFGF